MKQLGELQVPTPTSEEGGHGGQQQQQLQPDLAEQVLSQAETSWIDPPDEARQALQIAGLQLTSPGSDEDIMENAKPGTRGLSLVTEEKERYFGNLSGSKVQQELLRLARLLHGLLRDFAVVKDSMGHLHDDSGSLKLRTDRLEKQSFERLEEIMEDFEERLDSNDKSAADSAKQALEATERCGQVVAANEELRARFELSEARIAELEDNAPVFESFVQSATGKLEELRLQADDLGERLSANAEASRAQCEGLDVKVAEEAVARAAMEERLCRQIHAAEVNAQRLVRQAVDGLKQGALKELKAASEASAFVSRRGLREIAAQIDAELAARQAEAREHFSQTTEVIEDVENALLTRLRELSTGLSNRFTSKDALDRRLAGLEASFAEKLDRSLAGLQDDFDKRCAGLQASLALREFSLAPPSEKAVPGKRPETASTAEGDFIGTADFRSLEPGSSHLRYRPPSAPARVALPELKAPEGKEEEAKEYDTVVKPAAEEKGEEEEKKEQRPVVDAGAGARQETVAKAPEGKEEEAKEYDTVVKPVAQKEGQTKEKKDQHPLVDSDAGALQETAAKAPEGREEEAKEYDTVVKPVAEAKGQTEEKKERHPVVDADAGALQETAAKAPEGKEEEAKEYDTVVKPAAEEKCEEDEKIKEEEAKEYDAVVKPAANEDGDEEEKKEQHPVVDADAGALQGTAAKAPEGKEEEAKEYDTVVKPVAEAKGQTEEKKERHPVVDADAGALQETAAKAPEGKEEEAKEYDTVVKPRLRRARRKRQRSTTQSSSLQPKRSVRRTRRWSSILWWTQTLVLYKEQQQRLRRERRKRRRSTTQWSSLQPTRMVMRKRRRSSILWWTQTLVICKKQQQRLQRARRKRRKSTTQWSSPQPKRRVRRKRRRSSILWWTQMLLLCKE
eukprot:TRINITY_DN9748_c0_g1_i7.p1 TRINITY_DN9748_c0_g1~~TRINITY_DN9748_c0_g1_i7.p1  ORF type:complete len:906 (-),score=288.21 TRINITY_DN9748_c0_g1_i7:121-2838(-)